MKPSIALFAATFIGALAACSPQATPESNTAPTLENSGNSGAGAAARGAAPVQPAGNAAAAESGGSVDEAFLIGRWGRAGNCRQTLEFRAGGVAFPPEGSRWTMAGNVVTVTTPGGQPEPRTVARNSADQMTVSGEGPPLTLTRCR